MLLNTPLISICIPTYNGGQFLQACLDSAIGQSYRNIEIIIVDDCSTDDTYTIAAKYAEKDKRVRLFRNEKNRGLVQNWEHCIEISKGEWIKFLLQDDYLTDNCIETMLAGISANDKIAACKRTFLLSDSMNDAKKRYYEHEVVTFEKLGIKSKAPILIKPLQIASMAVRNICMNFIGEPTSVIFKKDVLETIGHFNEDLVQICDLEYFLRIGSAYGVRYIPTPLTYFRIHEQSTTSKNLQAKTYTLAHIDPIITVHQLLFDKHYESFRSNLSLTRKIKLNLYFRVRVYEAYKSKDTDSIAISKFTEVAEKYPKIKKYKNGSLFIKLMLAVIKVKRKAMN